MQSIFVLIVPVVVSIVILLIIREIVTWYWKINQIVKSQEDIIDLLKKIEINTSTSNTMMNSHDFKSGDDVKFTEKKLDELRRKDSLNDDLKKIGKIRTIEKDYADITFGKEIRRVNLDDIESVK